MVVSTSVVARRYEDVSAGTPISVDIPAYEVGDVYVYYGNAPLLAVQGTDYTVALAGDFETFTVTPTASLLTKINALIAADATEANYITVRRTLDYLTDATPDGVRYTPFTSREFDRNAMRDMQLRELTDRSVKLPPSVVGVSNFFLPQAGEGKVIGYAEDGALVLYPRNEATSTLPSDVKVFETNADVLADTSMGYDEGATAPVAEGDRILVKGGYGMRVAASGAVDHDTANASGVKLYCEPDQHGWVSIEQLGAVYDGDGAQTDQAAKVQALIDAGHKRISLGRSGTLYLASTITTPNNDPENAVFITSHGAKVQVGGNTRIFDLGQNSKVWQVPFIGSGETSGNTSENFIYISGNGLDDICHNTFLDCGGTAVIVRQYYTVHEGSQIIGNIAKRCRVAIDLQERGEYCTVSQNTIVGNGTGVIVAGGNNRVVDNTICDNDLGVLVTTGANDAHGQVGDNAINHNTINIQIDAINVDEMFFGGNLFYAGKIVLNGCSGVTFNGGVIDATCSIEQKACTNCWAIGVRMSGASAINTVANDGGPSELVFVDPVFDTNIAITSAASMGTSYAKARRTGAVTLSSGASTDLVFNSDNSNAIPANASYTVRDFFDVTTNKFQAKSQFLHRSFTVDFHALITVSHPSLSVAATDAAAEIVDADDTTNVLGVFTVSREKTLASGRKARVLSFSGKLERKDFKIRLYNDGATTLTIEADIADAPCFAELIGV